jgi:hypothetical protein
VSTVLMFCGGISVITFLQFIGPYCEELYEVGCSLSCHEHFGVKI